jgi:hypothetical protein
MKTILIAALAALGLMAGTARAEGPNAVEMLPTSRPIMAGQSAVDTGSEMMPIFSGAIKHSSFPVISDTGSEAMPSWASFRPVELARK